MMKQWSQLEEQVERFMEEEQVPGLAIAISQNGEVIYKHGFGYGELARKEPVTPETIFGIASVSKSFTALATMQLVEAGQLSVEDPVIHYLPQFQLAGQPEMEKIQIHHLLSHSTGVAPVKRREETLHFSEQIQYLSSDEIEILGEPGQYFSYCNDTFLLLGAIIEKLSGQSFRRYMTRKILDPLGMNRTTYSLEEVARFTNVSTPFEKNPATKAVEPVPWPTLGIYEVGGGIRSNVLDLLAYGEVYVNAKHCEEKLQLSQKTLQQMWTPYIPVGEHQNYGYALEITADYHGYTLVEHGGGQPGVSSNFGFVPEAGLVVAVLCNLSAVPIRKIWLAAVHAALGLSMEQNDPIAPSYQLMDVELHSLLGRYTSAEGSSLILYQDGEKLMAAVDEQVYPVRPVAKDQVLLEPMEKPVHFYLNEAGQAWAAFLGMRMLKRRS